MADKTTFTIWTESDRLCVQCAVQVAKADDWLCRGCRETLEADWTRLMPPLPPSPRGRRPADGNKRQAYLR